VIECIKERERERRNIFKDRPLEGKKNREGERMTPLLINLDVLM